MSWLAFALLVFVANAVGFWFVAHVGPARWIGPSVMLLGIIAVTGEALSLRICPNACDPCDSDFAPFSRLWPEWTTWAFAALLGFCAAVAVGMHRRRYVLPRHLLLPISLGITVIALGAALLAALSLGGCPNIVV